MENGVTQRRNSKANLFLKGEWMFWMDRMELGGQLGDYLVECCWTDRWDIFLSNNEREDLILAKGDGELGPWSGRLCSGLNVGAGDRLYQRWEGSQQSQDLWGDLRDPSGRGPAQGSRSHKSLKLFTKGPEGGGYKEKGKRKGVVVVTCSHQVKWREDMGKNVAYQPISSVGESICQLTASTLISY